MGIWHYPVKSYNSKQMVPASKTSVAQLIQPISNGSIVLAYDTLTTSDEWKRRVIRPANFKPRARPVRQPRLGCHQQGGNDHLDCRLRRYGILDR